MAVKVWTSPGGTFQVKRHIPDGYENETREECAERLGLDLSVFQYEDTETPEEKAQRIAEAVAEWDAYIEEEGLTLSEEEEAELDALMQYLGYSIPGEEDIVTSDAADITNIMSSLGCDLETFSV